MIFAGEARERGGRRSWALGPGSLMTTSAPRGNADHQRTRRGTSTCSSVPGRSTRPVDRYGAVSPRRSLIPCGPPARARWGSSNSKRKYCLKSRQWTGRRHRPVRCTDRRNRSQCGRLASCSHSVGAAANGVQSQCRSPSGSRQDLLGAGAVSHTSERRIVNSAASCSQPAWRAWLPW